MPEDTTNQILPSQPASTDESVATEEIKPNSTSAPEDSDSIVLKDESEETSTLLETGLSNEGELFEDALSDVQNLPLAENASSEDSLSMTELSHGTENLSQLTDASSSEAQQSSLGFGMEEVGSQDGIDDDESGFVTAEPESELRIQSVAAARAAKAREATKGKDSSAPVAILQTRGLQDEMQSILDNLV